MGEVGDVEKEFRLLRGGGFRFVVVFGNLVVDAAHLRLDGRAVLALRLHRADLLGDRLALVLEFLLRGFRRAPRLIAGQHLIDQHPMIPAARLQPQLHLIRLFPYHPYVQHCGPSFTDRRRGEKLRFRKACRANIVIAVVITWVIILT